MSKYTKEQKREIRLRLASHIVALERVISLAKLAYTMLHTAAVNVTEVEREDEQYDKLVRLMDKWDKQIEEKR